MASVDSQQNFGFRRGLAKCVALTVLCLVLAALVWTMDRASLRVQLTTYAGSYGFFVNAIPFVLIFILLLVVINRVTVAMLITLALALAFYVANFLKLKFLSMPVAFSDVYLLRDMHLSTIHLLSNYVRLGYLWLAALFLLAWIVVSLRFEWAFFGKKSWMRLLVGAVALYFSVAFGSRSTTHFSPASRGTASWMRMPSYCPATT